MTPIISDAQAVELYDLFHAIENVINTEPSNIKYSNMFHDMFGSFYALPFTATNWQTRHEVPLREIDYYKKTTANMTRLVTGMATFLERLGTNCPAELRDLDKVNQVLQYLIPIVAYREKHLQEVVEQTQIAVNFLNEVFAEVTTKGFGKFKWKRFENNQRPSKKSSLQARIEPTRTSIEMHMWKPGKDLHVYRNVKIYQDDTVDVVRAEIQSAWDEMFNQMMGNAKEQDAKLIQLKKIDRKPTNDEIKLIGTMLTVSNLGQPMNFAVDGNTLTINRSKQDLHKLNHCFSYANSLLDPLCEDRDAEQGVNAEQKSWFRILSGKEKVGKSKVTTLHEIAKTWPDFVPLCLWLAVNNK